MLVDNHGTGAVECSFPDAPCPAGSYKVLSFVAPLPADDPAANYLDFHFYVQHRDVVITLHPEDRLSDVARWGWSLWVEGRSGLRVAGNGGNTGQRTADWLTTAAVQPYSRPTTAAVPSGTCPPAQFWAGGQAHRRG